MKEAEEISRSNIVFLKKLKTEEEETNPHTVKKTTTTKMALICNKIPAAAVARILPYKYKFYRIYMVKLWQPQVPLFCHKLETFFFFYNAVIASA